MLIARNVCSTHFNQYTQAFPMDASANRPQAIASEPCVKWTIAEVERDTGIGKDTLRVWERRYGFPVPLRDALGDRIYPLDQVQRLRLIKRLLDAGYRPGKVVPLDTTNLQVMMDELPTLGKSPIQASATLSLLQDKGQDWLKWLSEDRTDLIRQALQQQILRLGLTAAVEQVIAPLCVHVGESWLKGELSVYQEHLFTEALQSVLRDAIASVDASSPAAGQPPRVLLTTTPGEQHSLGLLMAECFFAMDACTRFGLGVSTPVTDILQAVKQLRIDVVALSFSAFAARRDVLDALNQLTEQLPPGVELWVGGAAAVLHGKDVPKGVTVVTRASDLFSRLHDWRLSH